MVGLGPVVFPLPDEGPLPFDFGPPIEDDGVGKEGWKCWNREVEGSEDSERRVNAVWEKFDSRRYWEN